MFNFCFTVDDNIKCLKDVSENVYDSVFDNVYFAMLKRLHEKFNIKIQLNLFFTDGNFDLTMVSNRYKSEFENNSSWLKFSFHSKEQKPRPYEFSDYDEVYNDCIQTNKEIVRFAGENALAKTVTLHYCLATNDGLKALKDCNVLGLLGLYGDDKNLRKSYQNNDLEIEKLRLGETLFLDGLFYAGIDAVINTLTIDEIPQAINKKLGRRLIKIMIHEQYFYPDYSRYQKDFEAKLEVVFKILNSNGYKSIFFEQIA